MYRPWARDQRLARHGESMGSEDNIIGVGAVSNPSRSPAKNKCQTLHKIFVEIGRGSD